MKVKQIHFVDAVPGQPVYEMEGGEIRLPFPAIITFAKGGTTGVMAWRSEKECIGALTEPTPENKNIVIAQFANARNQIKHKEKNRFAKDVN